MSNMDELLLFLRNGSKRHNSIVCAFLVKTKKAEEQTSKVISPFLARVMGRLVQKRRSWKVTRNFIYPQPVRQTQRGPATNFSRVSTAIIEVSTRKDPRPSLFSAICR